MPEPQWRIDEIAQKAGLTVDTIRYYAREGLLMAPERSGRHKLYGPDHLDRLNRIRELQEQRFSLAAIRAIVNVDRPGLEDLFATKGHSYCFDDLVERSGLDPELVGRLRDVGPARRPGRPRPRRLRRQRPRPLALGRRATRDRHDRRDSRRARRDLRAPLPRAASRRARDARRRTTATGTPTSSIAIQRSLTANSQRMVPAVDRVLNYVHQRTIQRLTLEAVRTAEATGTGVGGVRVTDAESRLSRRGARSAPRCRP